MKKEHIADAGCFLIPAVGTFLIIWIGTGNLVLGAGGVILAELMYGWNWYVMDREAKEAGVKY